MNPVASTLRFPIPVLPTGTSYSVPSWSPMFVLPLKTEGREYREPPAYFWTSDLMARLARYMSGKLHDDAPEVYLIIRIASQVKKS